MPPFAFRMSDTVTGLAEGGMLPRHSDTSNRRLSVSSAASDSTEKCLGWNPSYVDEVFLGNFFDAVLSASAPSGGKGPSPPQGAEEPKLASSFVDCHSSASFSASAFSTSTGSAVTSPLIELIVVAGCHSSGS